VAIERMKKIAALVPAGELDGFAAWLHGRSVLHVTEVGPEPVVAAGLAPPEGPRPAHRAVERASENIAALEQVLAFCEEWGGLRRGFLEGLFSAKTVARVSDLEAAARALDARKLAGDVARLRERRDAALSRLAALAKEADRLRPFAGVDVPLASIGRLKRVRVVLLRLAASAREELERAELPGELAHECLSAELHWFAFPAADDRARKFVDSLGGAPEEIPRVESTVAERLAEIESERAKLLADIERLDEECRAFAIRGPAVELALGWWQAERRRAEGLAKFLRTRRVAAVTGYLPAAELERLGREVKDRFGGELLADDPAPGEKVPVRLRVGRFFRPVTLLVDMFGVPDYFSIDPTPFIAVTFLVFFGLCYSDAIYGLALAALSLALMRRFRRNAGLRRFFQLFLYGGLSTFVFGALLGSWAANLHEYLGPGNLLGRLRDAIPHFDPLEKPIIALVGVIFIGIANQYLGIALFMWRNWRRGDRAGAIFDGGLWFFYLSGLVILAAGIFAEVPKALMWTGVASLALGAVGLVLTQGRHEPTPLARFVTGLVSLYGILGSYGATGFISDSLSYSRLLALGLTTGIVGMSFNILAGIVSKAPAVGGALFALVVLFGHVFNFLMSIIGAFVHSARLILLEFFGRFYEAGGVKFEPFGFRSDRVEIVEGGA